MSQEKTMPVISQTYVLLAIVVVVVIGIVGVIFSHENAVVIIGFCTTITVSLFGRLQAVAVAEKVEKAEQKIQVMHSDVVETKADVAETKAAATEASRMLNGKMGEVLDKVATVTEKLATVTGRKEDVKAAEIASIVAEEHRRAEEIALAKAKEIAAAAAAGAVAQTVAKLDELVAKPPNTKGGA